MTLPSICPIRFRRSEGTGEIFQQKQNSLIAHLTSVGNLLKNLNLIARTVYVRPLNRGTERLTFSLNLSVPFALARRVYGDEKNKKKVPELK